MFSRLCYQSFDRTRGSIAGRICGHCVVDIVKLALTKMVFDRYYQSFSGRNIKTTNVRKSWRSSNSRSVYGRNMEKMTAWKIWRYLNSWSFCGLNTEKTTASYDSVPIGFIVVLQSKYGNNDRNGESTSRSFRECHIEIRPHLWHSTFCITCTRRITYSFTYKIEENVVLRFFAVTFGHNKILVLTVVRPSLRGHTLRQGVRYERTSR